MSHRALWLREAVLSQVDVIWRSSEDLHKAYEEHEREITEAIKSNRKKQADLQEEVRPSSQLSVYKLCIRKSID